MRKTVLITGASSGLGEELARLYTIRSLSERRTRTRQNPAVIAATVPDPDR